MFEKGDVTMWERCICGYLVIGKEASEVCHCLRVQPELLRGSQGKLLIAANSVKREIRIPHLPFDNSLMVGKNLFIVNSDADLAALTPQSPLAVDEVRGNIKRGLMCPNGFDHTTSRRR